ncbi:MAG: DUF2892 domain-containing protein [Candidatus Moranbacteria bacterium]|nr:DUF2892 domain-containing protein [Candidatus Moranbacteria bacterium]
MNKFRNESTSDRITRVVFGVALFFIAYNGLSGATSTIAHILAIILVATGLTGFCALYKLFGINTHKSPESEK